MPFRRSDASQRRVRWLVLPAPARQRTPGDEVLGDVLPAHLADPIAAVVQASQRGVQVRQLGFDFVQTSQISRYTVFHSFERSDRATRRCERS